VAAAQPLEARHVPLLDKLLAMPGPSRETYLPARRCPPALAAGGVRRHPPPTARDSYLRAARRTNLAAGRRPPAARCRRGNRAVDSDPYDADAVDLASGLAFDQGEPDCGWLLAC